MMCSINIFFVPLFNTTFLLPKLNQCFKDSPFQAVLILLSDSEYADNLNGTIVNCGSYGNAKILNTPVVIANVCDI